MIVLKICILLKKKYNWNFKDSDIMFLFIAVERNTETHYEDIGLSAHEQEETYDTIWQRCSKFQQYDSVKWLICLLWKQIDQIVKCIYLI